MTIAFRRVFTLLVLAMVVTACSSPQLVSKQYLEDVKEKKQQLARKAPRTPLFLEKL